jgi:hypothetical protein
MKRLIILSLVLGMAVAASAQVTKQELTLPPFHSIWLNSNYTVYVKQSNKQEITLEVLKEVFDLSEFKVENGVLHINMDKKPEPKNKDLMSKIQDIKLRPTMRVNISMKDIKQLHVNGGGKIIGENSIAADNLDLAVAGHGGIELDIKGKKLKTLISGPGDMKLSGYASENEVLISGSGVMKAYGLELEKATIKVTGMGEVEATVSDHLTAEVFGSGMIKHKGNTKQVIKRAYGPGVIDRAY